MVFGNGKFVCKPLLLVVDVRNERNGVGITSDFFAFALALGICMPFYSLKELMGRWRRKKWGCGSKEYVGGVLF
jgi:hypothetical protein